MLMNHINSWHGNNAFFIMQLGLSCTTKSLHFRGPNGRFDTHEKLFWGCKLGQISPTGHFNLQCIETFYIRRAIQIVLNLAFVAFYIRRCA